MSDLKRYKPEDVAEALSYISPDMKYEPWIKVGTALKSGGFPLSMWADWSRQGQKYHDGDCDQTKWDSFDTSAVDIGTVFYLAKEFGWQSEKSKNGNTLKRSVQAAAKNNQAAPSQLPKESEPIIIPDGEIPLNIPDEKGFHQLDQLKQYIELLFKPEEYVGFCAIFKPNKNGDKKPDGGVWYKAKDILAKIESVRATKDIKEVIGPYDSDLGAFIRINPLDGHGCADKNVTAFRWALVESDDIPLEKQNYIIKYLKLPVRALVYSGRRSLHAIVHIDANTPEEYKRRVVYMYDVLNRSGFAPDPADKNPSRYSRMPGVYRLFQKQCLIDHDIGEPDFLTWEKYMQALEEDLILPTLDDIKESEPQWLIPGYVPKGMVTCLVGSGGIGKTTCWCSIAASVSNGEKTIFEMGWEKTDRSNHSVLVFSAEDSVEYVLKKRLRQCNANMKNIHLLTMEDDRFSKVKFTSPFLEKLIGLYKPSLVVFDPLQSFIDGSGDMSKRNFMREQMAPLVRMGEKYGTTFLIIMHSNKARGNYGRMRMADSADIWDQSRSVLMAGVADQEHHQIYISHEKCNVGPLSSTVILQNVDGVLKFIEYSDKKDRDFVTDDLMAVQADKKKEAEEAVNECMNVIKSELMTQDGKRERSNDLDAYLRTIGMSVRVVKDAKRQLKEDDVIGYVREANEDGTPNIRGKWLVYLKNSD